jgi:HPt (histidine-containing phosphotransfer) domain-containing protein
MAMSSMGDVVDRQVFEQLAEELGSLDSARRIAVLYLDLLEQRVERLALACEADDLETAMDAVLSLKVTSATVGATTMRDRALDVESRLRQGGCADAASALTAVKGARAATAESISRLCTGLPAGSR